MEGIRKFILEQNESFSRRYELGIKDFPLERVGQWVSFELEQMGYVRKETDTFSLTEKGKEFVAKLLDNRVARDAVINDFFASMIENFPETRSFLDHLQQLDILYIPSVPSISEAQKILGIQGLPNQETYLEACKQHIQARWRFRQPLSWNEELLTTKIKYWLDVSKSTRDYSIAKTIFRDYFLDTYFKGEFGDVKYKFLRDRFHYFGMVNWSEHLLEFDGEILYSLVWLDERMPYSKKIHLGAEIYYYSRPAWKEIFKEFITALWEVYKKSPGVGYVPVMDLRDSVCYKLKISDYDFDCLLKEAFLEGQKQRIPIKISADPSKIPETSKKRLPVDFGKGMGIRTLIALERST
jgi:hypothetical protein